MDITEVILDQHNQQRRAFSALEEWPRDDHDGLAAVWNQLEILLELHAEAEEKYFYPELVKIGTGGADAESNKEQIEDALGDHNLLRDAIGRVQQAKVGSDEWWEAVTQANIVNSDHMGEEERQDLADFRQQASLELRHQIAVSFLRHMAAGWNGPLSRDNKDPEEFIADAKKSGPSAASRAAAKQQEQQTATKSEKSPASSVQAESPEK